MKKILLLTGIFLLGFMVQAETLKNLSLISGVKYTYLDENGNDMGNKAYRDKTGKFLVDNSGKTAITTKWQRNIKRNMSILFEFPIPVSPSEVDLLWMWGHNDKMWFTNAKVFIGNDKSKLMEVGSFEHKERKKQNSVTIPIKLKKSSGRFVRIDIFMKADVKHFMMAFGEIRILGSKAEYNKVKKAAADPSTVVINATRHYPSNIFGIGEKVVIPMMVKTPNRGPAKVKAVLYNYFKDVIEEKELSAVKSGQNVSLEFVELPPGYYELEINAEAKANSGKIIKGKSKMSLGVCKKFHRTAEEAIQAGCRMGIQTGFGSSEGADAFGLLGLQWIRALLQFGPNLDRYPKQPYINAKRLAKKWLVDRPFNSVLEVKTIPSWCYDEKRYGKRPKGTKWCATTVPLKKPYFKYIREQIECLPKNQHIFEVWNEPWDKMTTKEFAELCQMTYEAIKAVRPNSIIGPNLGPMAHLVKVIKDGGLKNMDMLSIHPYSFDFKSSPETAQLRKRIQAYRNTLKKYLGKELPLYVTEFGWPTPPEGPMANSEEHQAQYMTRAGLIMLAEDIKAIIPYCMGQPETRANEKEHFFGFVRKNKEPKPVLIAWANLNRMLEGSKYIGDLWLGTDIGAMLFEKDGINTLILYTDGITKKIFLRPFCDSLKIVDIVGNEKKVAIKANRLSLTLNDNPIYLVGVGDELKSKVIKGTGNRWSKIYKRSSREAEYVSSEAGFLDGKTKLKGKSFVMKSPMVPADDASAEFKIGWNEKALFLDINVTDNDPGNNKWDDTLTWKGDGMELYLSVSPDTAVPGFLKDNDYQVLFTPYSKSGRPGFVCGDTNHKGKKLTGVKYKFVKKSRGWEARLIIPFANFPGLTPKKGVRLALELAQDDLDKSHSRIQLNSNNRNDNWSNSSVWSLLILK